MVATSAVDSALAWVGRAWAKARAPVERLAPGKQRAMAPGLVPAGLPGGNLVGLKQRGAGGRVREGREPRVREPVDFCDANFQKADVGETRYAREPLRNRLNAL